MAKQAKPRSPKSLRFTTYQLLLVIYYLIPNHFGNLIQQFNPSRVLLIWTRRESLWQLSKNLQPPPKAAAGSWLISLSSFVLQLQVSSWSGVQLWVQTALSSDHHGAINHHAEERVVLTAPLDFAHWEDLEFGFTTGCHFCHLVEFKSAGASSCFHYTPYTCTRPLFLTESAVASFIWAPISLLRKLNRNVVCGSFQGSCAVCSILFTCFYNDNATLYLPPMEINSCWN